MQRPLQAFSILILLLFSSNLLPAQDLKYCGSTDMQLKLWQEHPELYQQQLEYDQKIQQQAFSNTRDDDQIYIIPIVFHVIHNYGAEDISDAQVEDEVAVLNEDYRKLNPDTAAIVNVFLGIAADAKSNSAWLNEHPVVDVPPVLTASYHMKRMKETMARSFLNGQEICI
jgi:hypothetical protein